MVVSTRAVSSVIGVALLLTVTVATMAAVITFGTVALDDTREGVGTSRAEKSLTQFDSQTAMVALGRTERQSVPLSSGSGDYEVRDRKGWLKITIENTTDGTTETLLNESLGALVHERGDTEIAYQGGGVWKQTDNATRMISPPEVHYRNGTLTLPIISMNGSGNHSLDGGVTVSKAGATRHEFPNATEDEEFTNPLENGKVKITVHSEYYEGWGEYFETRTTGGTSYDHDANEVTLTLLKQGGKRALSSPFEVASGSDATLTIQSGNAVVVANYDSDSIPDDQKSQPAGSGSNGDVTTSLDVNFKGNSEIDGNLTTTGSVSFGGGKSGLTGDLHYGEGTVSSGDCNKYVDGDCFKDADREDRQDIDSDITDVIDDLSDADENDNDATSNVSASGGISYTDDESTLDAGDYYVSGSNLLVPKDDTLVLNTTGGDIRIAVDNDQQFKVLQGGNITVVGDGRVNVYTTNKNVIKDGKIWNRGWDANQFWLYCTSGCHLDIINGAVFNGVFYAPPGPSGSGGDMEVRQGSKVFGAIVSGGGTNAELGQNSEIYFDETLEGETIIEQPTVPSISYLHVTVNTVNATSGT